MKGFIDIMDINPLIADLKKYKEKLIDSIEIAIGFNELRKADRYVAHSITEIKGEKQSSDPFLQIANIYNLSRPEVINNIRGFTNREYKTFLPGDPKFIKDLEFDKSSETENGQPDQADGL